MIPGLGRSPGEGNGYPLQYSVLENSMDYVVSGIAKSQTQLSNFHRELHCYIKDSQIYHNYKKKPTFFILLCVSM